MRKKVFASLVIVLLSLITILQVVAVVDANPTTLAHSRVTIQSPQERTYFSTDSIFLNITVETNDLNLIIGTTYYYHIMDGTNRDFMDGKDYRNSSVKVMEVKGYDYELDGKYYCKGSVILPSLSVGEHTVTIFEGYNGSDELAYVDAAYFNVEPAPFPTIAILASITSIVVITAVLLVYFRKRSISYQNA